jgi:hypothetical protein
MKRAIWILWPSFLVAGVAEMLFFSAFDPVEWHGSRDAGYTIGFFLFWLLAACSSALTLFLQRGPREINQTEKEY